jgi:hypothetical protein
VTTPQTPRDEVRLDEHLRTALRHAPDHGLSAPARLSQAILAAAAQVHRPARAAPAPEPGAPRIVPERQVSWRQALQSLLAPRWAGSIAAGLVAALVVGLWYGEEVPPPVQDERVASAPAPTPPGSETADRAAAAAPVSPRVQGEPSAATSPPAAAAPSRPAAAAAAPTAARKAEAQVVEPRAELSKVETERPASPAAPATSPVPPPVSPARPEAAADSAPITEAAPRIAREAASTGIGLGPAPAARDAQISAPAPSPPPAAALRRAPLTVDAAALHAEPPNDTVLSRVPRGPAAASPALTLLRRVSADAERRSAIWTWQPEAGTTARSFDADGLGWLQRLVYAARGRWVDVAERSDGATATEVRWWRNDEPTALLRIEARGLRWIEPSQRVRYAPMSADELARLNPPR